MMRALLVLAAFLAGCASAPPFDARAVVREWAAYLDQDHVLVPGDIIIVTAFQMEDLSQEITVPPEGHVNLKRIPEPIKAVGRKVAEFRKAVEQAYATANVQRAEISVNLKTPSVSSVYVAGEVKSPGAQPWTSHTTIAKAVAAAGGFLITAKPSDVLVVRPVPSSGEARSIRVNVDAILYGQSVDFPLIPGDVVWAQTSTSGDVAYFVELYLGRILPIGLIGGGLGAAAFAQSN
jgi:protein involved in polysaccharide export with SLBB domain